jgi:hypothetical protein
VNRHALIAAGAVAFALSAGVVLYVLRPEPEPAAPVAAPEAPRPAPAVREPEAPSPPEPVTPRPARRAAPVAEPAPEPAPVVPEAPPEVGTLHIEADVPNAQVFLDRGFLGAAPLVAENVKPGTHQLNVSAEGFDGFAKSIEVAAGTRDISIKFKEVRLDARLDVIHKHRMGSCRGRLVASPRGIRYETTNKNDGFTSALESLETFEVDYLDKNLRLKLRRGKQFNFTDPDGNADRLFVFHQDVEKARGRLMRGDQPASD